MKTCRGCQHIALDRWPQGKIAVRCLYTGNGDRFGRVLHALNFNEKRLSVTENRGMRNCERTDGVRNFENTWLEWVRSGRKRRTSAA